MSNEVQKDEPIRQYVFIPIDWKEKILDRTSDVNIEPGLHKYFQPVYLTEDAEFEIIEPKQLPKSNE